VTRGNSGLDAAVAELFAEREASGIVICGRLRDKGEAKARTIEETTGTKAVFGPADLGSVDDGRAVVAGTRNAAPRPTAPL
jgi:NAD(P)-dependent dehydrogenase (short-subunit alcohol dehydrogenase family)